MGEVGPGVTGCCHGGGGTLWVMGQIGYLEGRGSIGGLECLQSISKPDGTRKLPAELPSQVDM